MTEVVALGEVMLRFDPGEGRISTARTFQVSEGGGEYNVVRGLRRCFGRRTAVVTALADNAVGRLVEDLVLQGGVNDWSSAAWSAKTGHVLGPSMPGPHVLDRIGSGDGFATGLIHGLLAGAGLERALAYGTALGALTMTTPGDVAMASAAEVEALIEGASAAVRR